MSPITRIALRRIKRDLGKSILLMVAIFVSTLVISFLLFLELRILPIQEAEYSALPFQMFLANVRSGVNITVVCVALLALLTMRMHFGVRQEENAQTLAVLTSVGAVNRQIRKLIWIDILVLYIPSVVLGVGVGTIFCILIESGLEVGKTVDSAELMLYAMVAIAMIAIGIGMIILSNLLPKMGIKRRSVIGSVKKHNLKASQQKHSYRQSRTYREQALIKRLAKKSVDYHSKTYNEIALTFALAAMYPILAILLFWYVGNTNVLFETYQQGEIDAALSALEQIFALLGISFAVLTVVGFLQAFLMARVQFFARKRVTQVYLSVGMPESDIHKMIRAELKSVVLRSVIILIFSTYIINAWFAMVMSSL
ncbi:MAG: FtsX-like permease family protein [Clostridia bacterium]|nr:FtsX-like permease family protein [Clostridia bacterium]